MNAFLQSCRVFRGRLLLFLATALAASTVQSRVLDNFDDNVKTSWKDFSFVDGYGLPVESDGQLRFEIPQLAQTLKQPLFTASQKTSETFELKEGRTVEFRVDVIESGGKDSFAVLAFIPVGNGPGSLAGYGFAKSTTDVLITKGINKYFVADAGDAAHLKNNNITLVLQLTVKSGSVVIHATALDKDADNAVLWDRTVIDTPAADILADPKSVDDPAAPYITKGYFTLYCYADFAPNAPEDPYKIYYDNAQVFVNDTRVLDNFDDNVKTGWKDFSFVDGYGLPVETDGQFRFEIPQLAQTLKQPLFTASQKISDILEIKEGERLSLQVDLVEGGAKDSFAVLGFIPVANGPGSLAGYALAKSTTDVLIVKGINKYFVADSGAAAHLKNDNITLRLDLEAQNGNVIVHAVAYDKDADNAVLWERTVTDTPAADILADPKSVDDPAAPYITKGYFTLYCYADFDPGAPEDPYKVYFDNAIVSTPPLDSKVAPVISDIVPESFSNFLPTTTDLTFTVTDDTAIPTEKISVQLNGVTYTSANGLVITGTGKSVTAKLSGKLIPNNNYTAVLVATDSDNLTTQTTVYFDTFNADAIVIEAEDYNFSGQFINAPVILSEGSGPEDDAYSQQQGAEGIDFHDTRTSPHSPDNLYRSGDPIRMQHSLDVARSKFVTAGGAGSGVFDYDVGDIVAGEWMNYTHDFPAGAYEVYLRESLANLANGESVLELVTSDRSQTDQTVNPLGSFLGLRSGFQYRNFPLTDGSGATKIRLNLSGETTLRLRHITSDSSDSARYLNYLVFVRVGAAEVQRAVVTSLSPTPGSTTETLNPVIHAQILNRDTTINPATVQLSLNGQSVTPVTTLTDSGANVDFTFVNLPASGVPVSAILSFRDSQNQPISASWTFTVTYKFLDPANRVPGTGGTSGFLVHVVQAPAGSNLANSLQRAEDQIKDTSTIPRLVDVRDAALVINYNKRPGKDFGYFPDDILVPGIDASVTADDFTVEAVGYLQLAKGVYRFGVKSDDGYKLSSGKSVSDLSVTPLGFHSQNPADDTFDFIVTEPGLYPFRFLWFERGGDGYAEWYSMNLETGDRTLINDLSSPAGIPAFSDVVIEAPTLTVQPLAPGSNHLELSWPAGFVLQRSTSLTNPNWETVTDATSPYVIPFAKAGEFFRLVQKP